MARITDDAAGPFNFTTPLGPIQAAGGDFQGRGGDFRAVPLSHRHAHRGGQTPSQFESILGQTVTVSIEGNRGDPVLQRHGHRRSPRACAKSSSRIITWRSRPSVDADAECQEPHLPAAERYRHSEDALHGSERGLSLVHRNLSTRANIACNTGKPISTSPAA